MADPATDGLDMNKEILDHLIRSLTSLRSGRYGEEAEAEATTGDIGERNGLHEFETTDAVSDGYDEDCDTGERHRDDRWPYFVPLNVFFQGPETSTMISTGKGRTMKLFRLI